MAPGSSAKTASSNSGTMRPGAKQPRSPPCAAEPVSSELFFASVREVGARLQLVEQLLRERFRLGFGVALARCRPA